MVGDAGIKGKLVVFEGDGDVVSTQLRLLPTSPQILILPDLQCYLKERMVLMDTFNIPLFIREVHEAIQERQRVAEHFLKRPPGGRPCLVFLNGGAPTAQATCIKAIMKHHTDGDSLEATRIFDYVVKAGLSNLEAQWHSWKTRNCLAVVPKAYETRNMTSRLSRHANMAQDTVNTTDEYADLVTRAMRAADALDRETENLQITNELDLTLTPRPRSNSLPLYTYADNLRDSAPFFVFGAQAEESEQRSDPSRKRVPDTPSPLSPRSTITPLNDENNRNVPAEPTAIRGLFSETDFYPSWLDESSCIASGTGIYSPGSTDVFTPQTATFDSIRSPATFAFSDLSVNDAVGEGGLCPPPTHRRSQSVDRIFISMTKVGDFGRTIGSGWPSEIYTPTAVTTPTPRAETFGYPNRPKSLISVVESLIPPALEAVSPKIVRPNSIMSTQTCFRLKDVPQSRRRKDAGPRHVDKDVNAEFNTEVSVMPSSPFQAVFPIREDLLVYLKDDIPDALQERAVAAYRSELYPLRPQFMSESAKPEEISYDPSVSANARELEVRAEPPLLPPVPLVSSPPLEVDEYDPFAYTQNQSKRLVSRYSTRAPLAKIECPPTPEKTPTPSIEEQNDKFLELAVSSGQNAIAMQNSLRSLLNDNFPDEVQGYRRFFFPPLPEQDGLWQPIFRRADAGSPRRNDRRVDQILAIGSQRGVNREFAVGVTNQLEKLGMKSCGKSRSGRLDLRYLLANAMQAFTAQPLADQTSDNPFDNPYLLATLLIPHLETYLALHTEVRYLLLEYPPEHLPTVLAVQKLVGVDLMKVSQYIDSASKKRLPFTHVRGRAIAGEISNRVCDARSPKHLHSASVGAEVQLHKANFLLTSSASEEDIKSFIRAMAAVLVGVADFYKPERPVERSTYQKSKLSPLQSTFSAFPKPPVSAPQTPIAPSRAGGMLAHRKSPTTSTLASSTADTARAARHSRDKRHNSSKSVASRASRRKHKDRDAVSMYTFNPADDSDYDMEEMRLMPIFLQKPTRQKGSSSKALKFLGLA